MKYPRRFVDEDDPQALGIVGFKTFYHELNRSIVLDARR